MTTIKPTQADEILEKTFNYLDKILSENKKHEDSDDSGKHTNIRTGVRDTKTFVKPTKKTEKTRE